MARPKKNPLMQALIAELPDAATEWPVEKQIGWLNMMAMAFGIVYGGDAAQQFGARAEPMAAFHLPNVPFPPKFMKPEKPKQTYPLMIDEGGYVVKGNGERVNSKDVAGQVIHDMRGIDGDISKIIWADGSIGINGADFTLSPA